METLVLSVINFLVVIKNPKEVRLEAYNGPHELDPYDRQKRRDKI